MAHESFEDPAVATVMNERFVNIKVDREERPDLDQIYQAAHALMTRRSGGWPLTIFLTPDGAPYFAGTYFPKTPRYGMPGFLEILPRIAAAYHEQGPAIAEQSGRLARALDALEPADIAARTAGAGAMPGACCAHATVRSHRRRIRRRTQVSARRGARVLPARVEVAKRRRCMGGRAHVAREDGARRHFRSAWAAGSAGTASMRSGRSRISRKCSTTTRRCSRCTRTRRARAGSGCSPTSRTTSSAGSSARCARRTALSTRVSTPTARVRRASSTYGRVKRRARSCPTKNGRPQRRITGSTVRRTSSATRGICASSPPWTTWRHALRRHRQTCSRVSRERAPRCSPRARRGCAPAATTRS